MTRSCLPFVHLLCRLQFTQLTVTFTSCSYFNGWLLFSMNVPIPSIQQNNKRRAYSGAVIVCLQNCEIASLKNVLIIGK
ncbi:hypothetical protein OUZ56_029280 [Daphnia magna]|uniref:Secreted protein n=1 Tax=Daphnia magna TaxID=35525 RepID=A0ABR0B6D0_9CRUS|nr:hypothetical protein OUZ56_029280 [Daphnia magna]